MTATDFSIYTAPIHDWRELRKWLVDCTDASFAHDYFGEGRIAGTANLPACVLTRDSDTLEESNHATALEMLRGVSDAVDVQGSKHWAVGWVDRIRFPLTRECVEMVGEILKSIADYSVLDESDWSEREWNDAIEQWQSWGQSDTLRELGDELSDSLDELTAWNALEGSQAIFEDLWRAAEKGFTESGLGDSLSHETAAQRMLERIEVWHAIHAWTIITSNGNQTTLELNQ